MLLELEGEYYRTQADAASDTDDSDCRRRMLAAHHKNHIVENKTGEDHDDPALLQLGSDFNPSVVEENDETNLMAMGRDESENEDDGGDIHPIPVPPTNGENATDDGHAQLMEELIAGEFLPTTDQAVGAAEKEVEGLETWSGEINRMITSHIAWFRTNRMHWQSLQPHLCFELGARHLAASLKRGTART